jgi:hypothetical protein
MRDLAVVGIHPFEFARQLGGMGEPDILLEAVPAVPRMGVGVEVFEIRADAGRVRPGPCHGGLAADPRRQRPWLVEEDGIPDPEVHMAPVVAQVPGKAPGDVGVRLLPEILADGPVGLRAGAVDHHHEAPARGAWDPRLRPEAVAADACMGSDQIQRLVDGHAP